MKRTAVVYEYNSFASATEGTDSAQQERVDVDESNKFTVCKRLSADIVPAWSFKGWPSTAEEWIHRKREWPSDDVIRRVIETGCQIVAKQPSHTDIDKGGEYIPTFIEILPILEDADVDVSDSDKEPTNVDGEQSEEESDADASDEAEKYSDEVNNKDGYYRLSFSRCELVLAGHLLPMQKLCWKVLKAYQRAYFDKAPKVLTSYHWKTVLFWFIEETQPSFWIDEHFLDAILKLLDKMIDCLQKRFLPVYFVREQNLMTEDRKEVIEETVRKVCELRKHPVERLHNFIDNAPKPDNPKLSEEHKVAAESKPMTLLDVLNVHFNDSNAHLFSGCEKDVMALLKEAFSLTNNNGQIKQDQTSSSMEDITRNVIVAQGCNAALSSDDERLNVKQHLHDTLVRLSNTDDEHNEMKSKPEALEGDIALCESSSARSSTDTEMINVRQLYTETLCKLTGSSSQKDILNNYQGNSVIPESQMANLESILQLAGENLNMLGGGERGGVDPEFGRCFVNLMERHRKTGPDAPSAAHCSLDVGNIDNFLKDMQEKMKTNVEEGVVLGNVNSNPSSTEQGAKCDDEDGVKTADDNQWQFIKENINAGDGNVSTKS